MSIEGTAYAPSVVTVKRGSKVEWRNADPFPHTVTAAGQFDSGVIAAGASWSFTPSRAGSFDYICTLHPNMRGKLVVQ